jgi:integrase
LDALKAEHPDGLHVPKVPASDSAPGTIGALLDEWASDYLATVKGSTADNYLTQVEVHLKPALGDVLVSDLTVPQVSNFLRTLETKPPRRLSTKERPAPLRVRTIATKGFTSRPLGTKSKRLVRKVLAMALDYAMENHGLTVNVARNAKPPRQTIEEKERIPRYFEKDEALAFVRATLGDRLIAAWVLQLQLGLRPGEVRALAWSDIDFKRRVMHVRHSQGREAEKLIVRGPTKNEYSVRDLTFSPEVAAILMAHKERQIAEQRAEAARWEIAPEWNPDDLIFTNADGSPIRIETYGRAFAAVCARAEITGATPHALRHSCATQMIMEGQLLPDIARLMGHSDLVMLTTLYVHLKPGVVQGHESVLNHLLPA